AASRAATIAVRIVCGFTVYSSASVQAIGPPFAKTPGRSPYAAPNRMAADAACNGTVAPFRAGKIGEAHGSPARLRVFMEHAAAPSSATARDIVREILRNMREGLEPLHYSTLPP